MSDLHIPNLTIKNFRGIDELEMPSFGRVTLIAGRNSVGKTTVLDAIRIYAARGHIPVLWQVLRSHDEMVRLGDEDGVPSLEPDWSALFYERDDSHPLSICSNENGIPRVLTIGLGDGEDEIEGEVTDTGTGLRIAFDSQERNVPWLIWPGPTAVSSSLRSRDRRRYLQGLRRRDDMVWPFPKLIAESIGPHIPDNDQLSRYWDEIALTDVESIAFEALALASGMNVRGIAVITDRGNYPSTYGGRIMVGLANKNEPVPLRRLGEGAVRLFAMALAIANSRDGLLLIDEIENGIHYQIMPKIWEIILRLAKQNNVQVVATTHGWDCIWSLAHVALMNQPNEIVALRIERRKQQLNMFEFDHQDFNEITEHNLEIR